MFCSRCGQPNDDTGSFCVSCGSSLVKAAAPPMAPNGESMQPLPMRDPMAQQAPQFSQQPKPKVTHPYKTEYVLGMIGSIIGIIIFIFLIAGGIVNIRNNSDNATLTIVIGMFTLAAFILGFAGIGLLKSVKPTGGVLFVIGGGLGFIPVFLGSVGPISVLYFPLLLAAGIVALSRRKHVEQNYPQH